MSKKILHIAPTPFFSDRGCHIRIEGIVRCLSELGYENTVCTYHHGRDIASINTKRIKIIANYTQTAAGPSKYKLLADWRLLILCTKEYRRLRPQVIHAHLHEGLLIGLLIKWAFFWHRTPVIGDMQGSLSGELEAHGSFKKKSYLKWPIKSLEWCLMKFADHILCSSQHSLEKIQQDFSVNPNKVSLAQDGADKSKPLPKNRKDELQKKWSLPKDKTLVVYSGALLESKGLSELKTIIKAANSEIIHFLIIGYPTENLQPFLEQEQCQNVCSLTGQIDFEQLSEFLCLADIGIDPKNNNAGEGSGKMLNYLACGLPVVAFSTLNNIEFLPKGTPLAKDAGHVVELLDELAKNQALIKSRSIANLKQFEEHYSWQVCKLQLECSYNAIIVNK